VLDFARVLASNQLHGASPAMFLLALIVGAGVVVYVVLMSRRNR
jgi:hypothetical protein